VTRRDDPQSPRLRGKAVPEEGPSDEAMEAFAQAIADGLRKRYPGFDFMPKVRPRAERVARRRRASAPGDGDALPGD
jgi:hypothetical protein